MHWQHCVHASLIMLCVGSSQPLALPVCLLQASFPSCSDYASRQQGRAAQGLKEYEPAKQS